MIASFDELLSDAAAHNHAVGGFTAYNVETGLGIVEAVSRRKFGVMLLVSEQAFTSRTGPALTRMLVSVAAGAPVPCCVQLDHVADFDTITSAFEAGIGAVMADGSQLSYSGNVELVCAAAKLAARFNGGVEAELGRIEGNEEIAMAAEAGKLTDPDEAASFLGATGANCLAVSIGNAHGRYQRPPLLDLDRLERIRAATDIPLSLHGGSGVPDEQVIESIHRGIRKVNVNTELRDRYFEVVAEKLPELRPGAQLSALQDELIDAVSGVVESKLDLFSGTDSVDSDNRPKEA